MEKNKDTKSGLPVKWRLSITVIIAVISAFVCGFFFYQMRMLVSHMHVVFYFVLGVSVLVLIYMGLWILEAFDKYSRLARILKRSYFLSLLIGLVCFAVLQILIISGSRTDNDAEVDAVIVMGAGLINNKPSLILSSRLNAAITYIQTRDDIPVIVTGGLGGGQEITEAEAMARYLIARGVDEDRIWKEDTSTNSYENIRNVKYILKDRGIGAESLRFAIVSNEFHLYRAKIIAGKLGLEAVGVAAETPGLHRKVIYFFREAFSLTNELIFR